MSKSNLNYARTCVYNVNYHLVWSTKYRKKVLNNIIETSLKEIFDDIAEDKGFLIQQIEVGQEDHVHLFVTAHPKIAPSYIVKMLKGISGRRLFIQFPELKKSLWKGHLWNPSYYIETVGSISETVVKQYIDKQKKG